MGILERQQQREIDGVTYVVNPLPFGLGRKALLRFTKLAGPVLSSAAGENGLPAAIATMAGVLSDEDLDYFAKEFGNASWYVDGEKNVPLISQNQPAHFDGRYTAFFEWLAFNVEVNFAPFFSDVMKRAGIAVTRALPTSSESAARTG